MRSWNTFPYLLYCQKIRRIQASQCPGIFVTFQVMRQIKTQIVRHISRERFLIFYSHSQLSRLPFFSHTHVPIHYPFLPKREKGKVIDPKRQDRCCGYWRFSHKKLSVSHSLKPEFTKRGQKALKM